MYELEKKIHELGWLKNSADKEFINNNNTKQNNGNIVTSLLVAFFIIFISANVLGFINGFVENNFLEKEQNRGRNSNAHLIIYSGRC